MKKQDIKKILASLDERDLPEGFHSRLKNKLKQEPRPKAGVNSKGWYRLAAGIAALFIIFVAVRLAEPSIFPFRTKSSDQAPAEATNQLDVEAEEGKDNSNRPANGKETFDSESTQGSKSSQIQISVDDMEAAKAALYKLKDKYQLIIMSEDGQLFELRLEDEDDWASLYTDLQAIGSIKQDELISGGPISIYIIED